MKPARRHGSVLGRGEEERIDRAAAGAAEQSVPRRAAGAIRRMVLTIAVVAAGTAPPACTGKSAR
jgi:hypothetical protein